MVADHVVRVIIDEGGEFAHGMTYAGHPTACAVAAANIRILRDEGIIDTVREDTGPYLQQCWRELGDHPLVGEVRGLGFLGALELVADKTTRTPFDPTGLTGALCRDIAADLGLVMRAVGDTMIISPPLVMSHEEIDELIGLAQAALDETSTRIKT
jgi:putrescine aminotransferase